MAKSIPQSHIRDIEQQALTLMESQLPEGFYLLSTELEKEASQWFLRVYIDKNTPNQKVTLDDCATVSHALDPLLSKIPLLEPLSYSFEVSSPGAFRPLTTPREFLFFKGRTIQIENQKGQKVAEGVLSHYNQSNHTITIQKDTKASPMEKRYELNEGHYTVTLHPDIRMPNTEDMEDSSHD